MYILSKFKIDIWIKEKTIVSVPFLSPLKKVWKREKEKRQ